MVVVAFSKLFNFLHLLAFFISVCLLAMLCLCCVLIGAKFVKSSFFGSLTFVDFLHLEMEGNLRFVIMEV